MMRSRALWSALSMALLAVSCAEQEPPTDLPLPPGDPIQAYASDPEIRRKVDEFIRENPDLAEDYVQRVGFDREDPRADPDDEPSRDAALFQARGAGRIGDFILWMLGGGAVLVAVLLVLVRLFRHTGLSMDLAVRASRRRYLERCRKSARRRSGEGRAGMAGHGAS